jgi:hypothetical protein
MKMRILTTAALLAALLPLFAWADPAAKSESSQPEIANGPTLETETNLLTRARNTLRVRPATPRRPVLAPVVKPPPKLEVRTDASVDSYEKARDLELRKQVADRLEQRGFKQYWEALTLDELLDKEHRIEAAGRLRERGIEVSWARKSYPELLEIEKRLMRSDRLLKMGKSVDWRKYSSDQLAQMEIELCQRARR